MNCRILYFVAGIATLVSLAQGQTVQSNWTAPRTPDGRPDFQGGWANNIATPLERPGGNWPDVHCSPTRKWRQATVRLMRRPESVKTLLAIYDRAEDAGNTVSEITRGEPRSSGATGRAPTPLHR